MDSQHAASGCLGGRPSPARPFHLVPVVRLAVVAIGAARAVLWPVAIPALTPRVPWIGRVRPSRRYRRQCRPRQCRLVTPYKVALARPQHLRIGGFPGVSVRLSSNVGEVMARIAFDAEVPLSGVVIPIGGPDLLLSRLLDWPEEGYAPGWDTLFVSIEPLEEE